MAENSNNRKYCLLRGYYIALISIHGLVRGTNPEYGRDADTGGQVRYVLELSKALADHYKVERVDILTRRIVNSSVSEDYSKEIEQVASKVFVVRSTCGPSGYIAKEQIWPYLQEFAASLSTYFKLRGYPPDILHSHYADSGVVARILAQKLKIPHIHTSHSLGRVKQINLQKAGFSVEEIESKFKISKRILAEENIFSAANLIIASTRQEVEEQYCLYRGFDPQKIVFIAPGVDTSVFRPPMRESDFSIGLKRLSCHLEKPDKAMILAISRPDESKNIATLIKAYAREIKLRELSNLVIVSGKRQIEPGAHFEPNQSSKHFHHLIENCRLEGQVAIFEALPDTKIVEFYQLAFLSGGVFVNPAFNEPFGLTLLEAAAVGLPIISTQDAGPRAIVEVCQNGRLINPLDTNEISRAILEILSDKFLWEQYSSRGISAIPKHFSWANHAKEYLRIVDRVLGDQRPKTNF